MSTKTAEVLAAILAAAVVWSWFVGYLIWWMIVSGYGGEEAYEEHCRRKEEIHQEWLRTFGPDGPPKR